MSCEWITSLKDISVGLSAAFATYFAYQGLNTWRRELKGRSEYQLAKDTLRAAYSVREAFKRIRHPAIYGYEYPEEMIDHLGHLKEENKAEGMAHVYQERWKSMDESFIELERCFLEALVEWGSDYQDIIIDLRKLRAELLVNIQHLVSQYKYPHRKDWMGPERRERFNDVLYQTDSDKSDPFSIEINAAVRKFDDWLRPHVSRK